MITLRTRFETRSSLSKIMQKKTKAKFAFEHSPQDNNQATSLDRGYHLRHYYTSMWSTLLDDAVDLAPLTLQLELIGSGQVNHARSNSCVVLRITPNHTDHIYSELRTTIFNDWLLHNLVEASIDLLRRLTRQPADTLGTTSTGIIYEQSESQTDLISAIQTWQRRHC